MSEVGADNLPQIPHIFRALNYGLNYQIRQTDAQLQMENKIT